MQCHETLHEIPFSSAANELRATVTLGHSNPGGFDVNRSRDVVVIVLPPAIDQFELVPACRPQRLRACVRHQALVSVVRFWVRQDLKLNLVEPSGGTI